MKWLRNPLSTHTWLQKRYLSNHSITTYYALLEACLIGCVSALAALLLRNGIASLGWARMQWVNHWGVWSLPLFCGVLGCLAGAIVEYGSLASQGGGIPQVKAALARFPIPLSLRVAGMKLLGTIFVLGAGLTLGRRGPTVHIGAALAAQLSMWVPTSPLHRRQMIAAGAAAGLAAGFNTPIAGVLFVVEELSRDMSGLTLETAILASFTGSVISRLLGSADLNLPMTILAPGVANSFQAVDIPFYVVLGVLAGILGVLFNQGLLTSLRWNRRWGVSMVVRIGCAALVSGVVIAIAPPFFRDNAGLRDFLITGDLSWRNGLMIFAAHFGLTLLAYGSGAPGGLFSPALVLGSSLGYLVGTAKLSLLGMGSETTYTLVGMGAFFTAVARVPVTAIVIIFELTTDFRLVLPLMISTAIAYGVAEALKPGSIYQHLLKASGIHLDDEGDHHDILADLQAHQVMQHHVETLHPAMTLQEVWQVCRHSHHHGFPVVQRGQLVGMITEQHLAKLAGQPPQSCIREYMDRQPIGIHPGAVLSDVLYLMDRQHISHLPVTEGRKLVGIITRSDLIHATADELRGVQRPHTRDPSYGVYRTRDPATGEGRLLLPISDAALLPQLLPLAGAIAADKNYEIECLHVITVPPHHAPAQTRVNMQTGIKLLQDAQAYFARWQIPVHTQIRVAHQVAPTILEMIQLRQIDLLVMAWLGRERTPQTLFGMVTDTILRESTCDVLLLKPGSMSHAYPQRTRWLIPISGGPNIRRALEFLPSFYTLATAESIILTQVCVSKKKQPRWKRLKQTAIALQDALPCPIESIPLQSAHIAESVKQLAETKECGLVIVGASRESMLQHALHGNIPNAIASGVEGTVLLFQKAPTRKLAGEEGIGARSAERDEVN